ncbi:MAG: TrkH family potassium uptake protein [Bacillota bacterium]
MSFALAITVGTVLLLTPAATVPGRSTDFIEALFTATSAVCVTGLIVVDTASHWTPFGQAVILALIQVGGLGIMTMSTMFALLLGRRITFRQRVVIQASTGQFTFGGLVRLVKYILLFTLAFEGAGAVLLALRFARDFPLGRALWMGIFHSVSAFCNAGFDITGVSFTPYVSDLYINIVIPSLIILGGLGFFVVLEIWTGKGRPSSLHTRLALKGTLFLLAVGFLAVLVLEHGNPSTMGNLGWGGKIMGAWFHSVTPRTAGFNTLPTGDLRPATLFITIALMFIGGSPGGTAGGIKTTTFFTLVAVVVSAIKGAPDVEVMGRRLGLEVVRRAMGVLAISLVMVFSCILVLTISESMDFLQVVFEVFSAFGTVGLSTGITSQLNTASRLAVIATMFVGRVGPLTMAMAIAAPPTGGMRRFPEERIMVG